jgi:hypothetical protein
VDGDPAVPVHPEDAATGYRYDVSVLEAGFSLTQILDKPARSSHVVALGNQNMGA